MTTWATSIPKNSFRLYRQRPEEETVRPRLTGPPPFASPHDPHACPRAIGGSPSAFLGASENPPRPHRGRVPHNQSP